MATLMNTYGTFLVSEVEVCRMPIKAGIQWALNLLSVGQFNREMLVVRHAWFRSDRTRLAPGWNHPGVVRVTQFAYVCTLGSPCVTKAVLPLFQKTMLSSSLA